MDKLVLIDGHSILNRAFYGVPDLMNSEGLHTSAVYGFLNIMFKILEEEEADHLAMAFDLKKPTFRHKMYDGYRDTREPMSEELHQQVQVMKDVLTAMGVPIIALPGFEADDILGTVTKKSQARGIDVSMVSDDRGLLQLVDERIRIRIPKTSRTGTEIKGYYPEDVKKEYQVTPVEFIGVKALMGDAPDNIPGIPSIGERTTTSPIAAYGSIENYYSHLDEIKPPRAQKALEEHYDMAQMSKKLATICLDCPVEFWYEDAKIENLYTPGAYQYMKWPEFGSLLTWFDASAVKDSSKSSLEEHFFLIRDEKEAGRVFAGAGKRQVAGLQLITGRSTAATEAAEQMALSFDENGEMKVGEKAKSGLNPVTGLALCLGEDEIYRMAADEEPLGDSLVRRTRVLCIKRAGKAADKRADRAEGAWILNLKEMLPYLEIENTEPVYDGEVAGYLLNPLKDTYAYGDLTRDYLGPTVPSRTDLLAKADLGDMLWDEDAKAVICAHYMGYVAWKTAGPLKQQPEATGMYNLFKDIEMPLIYSLYHIEREGIKVERENLTEYGNHLKMQIDELKQEIYRDTDKEFNISSSKQLGEILFGDIQPPGGKKTKAGYFTTVDVLDKLAPDYPMVQKILDYHQLTRLNSTYAQGLATYIGEDGRIHGEFNQTITVTGRISSTEPSLQSIPIRMVLGREVRRVPVPKEEYVFADADYSQVGLRILTHVSGDERLIGAYCSTQDICAIVASETFHVPLTEVTSLQRRNAKAVNFGIVYGISAFGFSEDLSISRREVVGYIDRYFETYSRVKVLLDNLVSQGEKQGYVTTLYGRIRPISELKSTSSMQRQFGERMAMNSPIQGSAADIMKITMITVDREFRSKNLKSRIVLQIHGELLIETARDEVEIVRELLVDKMKRTASLEVSLEVEAEAGGSWFDAK